MDSKIPKDALLATHIPLLTRTFDKSEGDVLEIGTGYFSTLLLKWLCTMSGRTLYAYENRQYWYDRAKGKETPFYKVFYTPNYDDADIDRHWGMVFIDHGPNARRVVEIKRLANLADYIVIHDTQPINKDDDLPIDYHYETIWPLFKYRYDYTKIKPWTSVVSNFKDLSNLE